MGRPTYGHYPIRPNISTSLRFLLLLPLPSHMLLPLYHHHPSFSSKALASLPSPFPKSPFLCCNSTPSFSKSLLPCRSSPAAAAAAAPDTKTLPQTAIQRIAEKLRSLGYIEEDASSKAAAEKSVAGDASAGEIFLPLPHQLPKHRVGHTIDVSWSTPENPVPRPGSGTAFARFSKVRKELGKQRREAKRSEVPLPTLAELTIPEEELRRLQSIGIRLNKKLKVGKAGITEGIVNGIHERWRRSELVKIKCEDICRINMKRTHETLERKTGGLVVWRSGSIIILYRGANYKYPYFVPDSNTTNNIHSDKECSESGGDDEVESKQEDNSSQAVGVKASTEPISPQRLTHLPLVPGVGSPQKVRFLLPGEIQLEEEVDRLLDGLGPRFTDWWGYGPLPVDADLLPAFVPGYRKPFRLLPFGVHPKLTDREMTILKRIGRPLPCHFALGRNRRLQGLAAAIVKLWEKSEIAKIAVKRGVQNTSSKMMAEELKMLTGGVLLSRDREFFVLYRGKDFLPPAVSAAIEERRKCGIHKEKQRRSQDLLTGNAVKGKAEEVKDEEKGVAMEKKLQRKSIAVKTMETKLSMALEKKVKAEKLLEELQKASTPQGPDADKEGITEEERHMLRKVGLRMKAFLLLGRRGVFAGTVENMHLHWKYRELIKILCKERSIEDVHMTARTLEAESGGILVAVERVSKGHAIIVYRGKNYRRPAELRPQSLLNKRQAMKRSLEAQRSESLKLHVLKLTKDIDKMKLRLAKTEKMANLQSAEAECIGAKNEPDGDDSIGSDEIDDQENVEAEEKSKNDADPVHSIASMDSFSNGEGNVISALDLIDSMQANPYPCHSAAWADSSSDSEENVSNSLDLKVSTSEMDCMKQDKPIGDLSEYGYMLPEVEHPEFKSSSSVPLLEEVEYSPEHPEIKSSSSDPVLDEVEYSSDRVSQLPKNLPSQVRIRFSPSVVTDYASNDGPRESTDSSGSKLMPSVYKGDMDASNVKNAVRVAPLTNKDRLILRKQALRMKRRPLFAIVINTIESSGYAFNGRSNAIAGAAKAITQHFERSPLAVVNVKGRAKGTSIQQMAFELQQATGALLVSVEENKVILHRGWQEEPGASVKKKKLDIAESWESKATAVSPQLLAAVRVECGLQNGQQDLFHLL
ncbi:hypothetical protein ACLOJK_003901 [Asimina triloba]